MAVTVLNNPAGLRLKFDLGKDDFQMLNTTLLMKMYTK